MTTTGTHEHTINDALGEVLDSLRRSWTTRSERTGEVLEGGGRPDILIEKASGWPVVIEAERRNYATAEAEAKERLGRTVASTGREIETSIALVYPSDVLTLSGQALRDGIEQTKELRYALYTRRIGDSPERLPSAGWIHGSVRDLAMLIHRAAVPPLRVESLAEELEMGVRRAEREFTLGHPFGSELGKQVANVLGQTDDKESQTRRMAMTVIANALIFHESLAQVEFQVQETEEGPKRRVKPVDHFRQAGIFAHSDVCLEWERILSVNYWPIFWSAKEMLHLMPTATAHRVLQLLWQMGEKLVAAGVTRSHDLTGIIFQRLIADRKFLATYYTRPEAAALLAALALPVNRPPGGADWGDGETLASAQIGDFACGTGTLLSMAYQRLSLLHELYGGDPRKLHGPMMRHGLVGLDVLNIGVHLTAAMLAGSQPETSFEGECLLTMPYGGQGEETVAIGSLELLAPHVQPSMMDTAAAVSAGGRSPEEVRDIVSRVGHNKFDLVIMNPPFVRSTGMESEKRGTGNPAFAAFNTDKATQKKMQRSLTRLRGGKPIGSGNNGLAADFLDLALRKAREDGVIALVLPLSAVSGIEWEEARKILASRCQDITVITIAGPGSYDSSFSADTKIAECLLIARLGPREEETRATFVMLRRAVRSAAEAELLASAIEHIRDSGRLRSVEHMTGLYAVTVGEQGYGVALDAPLPGSGPWPFVGIVDTDLAQIAWNLERGAFVPLGQPNLMNINIPVLPVGKIAGRGPYHADIYWNHTDGTPRGPFELVKLTEGKSPTYPILWAHDAKLERRLVVVPDYEGHIKPELGAATESDLLEKASAIWETATRVHYNRDLRFTSQSLIVAMTEHPCIGGEAWPSVILESEEYEYPFVLWCNSTLGVLMHWWVTNKTQSGRGRTTVTGIPQIPTLDIRTLSTAQLAAAKEAFEELLAWHFLPFDQIDEDAARAELDRRLLVDVLGLPETLVEPGGSIDLIRRKLAREPQIHGGKKTRVVFDHAVDANGQVVTTERKERRSDR